MTPHVRIPLVYFQLILASILSRGTNGDVASMQNGASSGNPDEKMEELVRLRRQGNFVRIGRPSNFVRIGKMDPDHSEHEHSEFIRSQRLPHMNRFIRIGRNDYNNPSDDGSTNKDWLFSKIKRPSSFVRIGKSDTADDDEFQQDAYDKRGSGFVRIGKGWNQKRPSGFVRIGKGFESDEGESDLSSGESGLFGSSKRVPGFVRIGKSPQAVDESSEMGKDNKRASSFVRIGKSSLFNPDLDDNFQDSEDDDGEKRASGFVRIGKSNTAEEFQKRVPGFVRIGKSPEDDTMSSKRASGFVRIGKAVDELMHKRVPGFVRIGKSNFFDDDDEDDLDNSLYNFNRPERSVFNDGFDKFNTESSNDEIAAVKKASGFVRIGKSSNLLNSDTAASSTPIEADKRASGFVRIGKDLLRAAARERDMMNMKKSSGFVRIGKQVDSAAGTVDRNPISVQRRGSAFVRIGKIPSAAFVTLSKAGRVYDGPAGRRVGYRRRSRNGQSSFVRIG